MRTTTSTAARRHTRSATAEAPAFLATTNDPKAHTPPPLFIFVVKLSFIASLLFFFYPFPSFFL